jgi:predicted porin
MAGFFFVDTPSFTYTVCVIRPDHRRNGKRPRVRRLYDAGSRLGFRGTEALGNG